MQTSEESLKGRTVIGADGQVIGVIVSLSIDQEHWRIDAVGVELRKEIADRIGIDRSLFRRGTIEVPVRAIQSVGDTVVLAIPVDELRTTREPPPPAPTSPPP